MGVTLFTQIYNGYQIQLWRYKDKYYCVVQNLLSTKKGGTQHYPNPTDAMLDAFDIISDLSASEEKVSYSRHNIHNL